MITSRGSPLPTLPVLPPKLLPHRALPAPIGLGAPRGGQPERLDAALDAGLGEMSGMDEARGAARRLPARGACGVLFSAQTLWARGVGVGVSPEARETGRRGAPQTDWARGVIAFAASGVLDASNVFALLTK